MTPAAAPLPVTLLTGFLGSGKTTLLNRLVRQPAFADCVVIVNEFGEIGLDNLLIEHVEESMRILDNGCVCCSVRGDLIDTLADLAERHARGEMKFARAVIETTGLADPAPIIHSLTVDPVLSSKWQLQAVVTTVDAVNGAATLDAHPESVRQAGMADVIVLTKTDLAVAARIEGLRRRVRSLNPQARFCQPVDGELAKLLANASFAQGWKEPELPAQEEPCHDDHHHDGHSSHDHHDHRHHENGLVAHCLVFDEPLEESAFLEWLDLLAAMRGENLLRVKGIIAVAGDPDRPRVVQCVQHVVHPVVTLAKWPSEDHRTRMVFIVQNTDVEVIERTFRRYGLGSTSATN